MFLCKSLSCGTCMNKHIVSFQGLNIVALPALNRVKYFTWIHMLFFYVQVKPNDHNSLIRKNNNVFKD